MTFLARQMPAAVVRGKRLAEMLLGRRVLFKTSGYMGPVRVEQVRCTYRWFYLRLSTRPWRQGTSKRLLDWQVPTSSLTEFPSRIVIRAYDVVGILIHDGGRIRHIEQLRREGARVQEIMDAFNTRAWPAPTKSQIRRAS
jgi:hypothetical protein